MKKYIVAFLLTLDIITMFSSIIVFIISIVYLINGSLEIFPTPEKQNTIRTVSIMFIVISIIVFLICTILIKKIKDIHK